MKISADVNPVIYTDIWPSSCRQESPLTLALNKKGVYLLLKQPRLSAAEYQDGGTDVRLWRMSFSHLETELIAGSKHREALLLAKAIRLPPICPKLTSNPNKQARLVDVEESDPFLSDSELGGSSDKESENPSEESQEAEEVNAEQLLQTYYLKQLFFDVTHDMSKASNQSTPVSILA